jgi:hypothetical protein
MESKRHLYAYAGMVFILVALFGVLVFKGGQQNQAGAAVSAGVPAKCVVASDRNAPDFSWKEMKCSQALPPNCDNWDFCKPR